MNELLLLPYYHKNNYVSLKNSSNSFIVLTNNFWFPGFICVLFYTTIDGLYFVLTSHVCANFSVISDMIERLDETTADRLADIIKDHQYILK